MDREHLRAPARGGFALTDYPVYSRQELPDDAFPFKIEIRTPGDMNRIRHAHEHLQLLYMMSGSCLHWAAGREYVLTKGDLVSIPPYREHLIGLREGMDFRMVQVDFMPDAINESFRDLAQMPTFIDFAYIRPLVSDTDAVPKIALPPPAQAVVETLLNAILTEWKEREEGYKLAIKAELLKLLVVVGRQYTRDAGTVQPRERQKVADRREAFYGAIAYMEKHYEEELTLEEVAAKALMAPSYFSYMLRLLVGRSYIELLSSIRIRAAMELLGETDLSVTEIAARAGYNHVSHFNRTFKKHTGVTPGDYRKQRI